MQNKSATTSTPILNVLADRWSPRAFNQNHEVDAAKLTPALEAARWAPSASNSQPARFNVGLRGTKTFTDILDSLTAANARWAKNASALIVASTEVHDAEGKQRRWAEYDLGQAVAHLSVQAHADGLFVHQMGGFDGERIALRLNLPEAQRVVTVLAVGVPVDPHSVDLAEHHLAQELGARLRRDLSDTVTFGD